MGFQGLAMRSYFTLSLKLYGEADVEYMSVWGGFTTGMGARTDLDRIEQLAE